MEIGGKIKQIRLQLGLTQEELADRCELSKSFISLLERNLTSPSIDTLNDILICLGTDLATFFLEQQQSKVVFTEEDISSKKDSEMLHGAIHWLVPNAQKNRMEPILVELGPDGRTPEESPHEGEEFGYVLTGQITVHIGDLQYNANQDESFCFEPTSPHWLANAGNTTCKVLWVSTPPSF